MVETSGGDSKPVGKFEEGVVGGVFSIRGGGGSRRSFFNSRGGSRQSFINSRRGVVGGVFSIRGGVVVVGNFFTHVTQ